MQGAKLYLWASFPRACHRVERLWRNAMLPDRCRLVQKLGTLAWKPQRGACAHAACCTGHRSVLRRLSHRSPFGKLRVKSEKCKVLRDGQRRNAHLAPAQFLIQNSAFIIIPFRIHNYPVLSSKFPRSHVVRQETAVPTLVHHGLLFLEYGYAPRVSPILNSKFNIHNYPVLHS